MEFTNVDTNISKLQGNIGVARAIYEYTKKGYTVLAPLSDSSKYDLVIDNGESLLRVQVKTSRCKSKYGGYTVNLKTSGGNTKVNTIRKRESGDYDVLFALVEDGRCWSIPSTELGDLTTGVVLGSTNFKQFLLNG